MKITKEITIHGKTYDYDDWTERFKRHAAADGLCAIVALANEYNKNITHRKNKIKVSDFETYNSSMGSIKVRGRKLAIYYFLMIVNRNLNNNYTILF